MAKALIVNIDGEPIGTSDHPLVATVTNIPETQEISGTVNVGNLPTTQAEEGEDAGGVVWWGTNRWLY